MEYEKAIDNTPKYFPVFEVIKVPDWAIQYGVKIGDRNNTWGGVKGCAIQPSYLKFIGYEKEPADD